MDISPFNPNEFPKKPDLSRKDRLTPEEVAKEFENFKKKTTMPVAPVQEQPKFAPDEVLISVKDLPSKFLPYPKGSSISYKPFTYGDIQTFNASMLTYQQKCKFMLDGIVTDGFPKENLTTSDFQFISLLRKISAFSKSKFTYQFYCEACGDITQKTGELQEIEFKDLELPSLPVIIDLEDGEYLAVSPLTIGASIRLANEKDDLFMKNYAASVVNMHPDKAYKILKAATGDLIVALDEVDSMLALDGQSIDCLCEKCQTVNKFPLGDIQNLIAPFRGPDGPAKRRIRFG